ncbi:MAG: hypothetical protein HZC29_00750, partial [Thaumarchaeota archaeon]|nr:hypothetical protein [Nitrososphaerota archaeon]
MKTKAKIIATDSLGARSVEIKTRNALIYTPTRAVTSTELRYVPDIVKAGYNNVVFPSQIVELILDFRDKSDRDAILRSNTAFASRIRNIRTLVSKADEKVTILRPAVRPNDVISSEFIEATIQAGVESGCTKISVLDTSRLMSADDQVKLLNRMEKFASGFSATLDRKIELMPSIRINVDDVRTLTNRIRAIKDMGYDELNVILASYADYSRNYMEFRKR